MMASELQRAILILACVITLMAVGWGMHDMWLEWKKLISESRNVRLNILNSTASNDDENFR
ncbi:MAG: hypothetical protein JRI72_00325 [Deltaproteobacteria bacterium]|nr:hypothetical protein [Deltaproteobacteria bacterium]